MKKLGRIENKLDTISEIVSGNTTKDDLDAAENEFVYKGINVHRIPSSNPYSYGLQLLDALFDKDELANSLMFESTKSDKAPLNKDRVTKLFKLIDEKFKHDEKYKKDWDIKLFVRKANQKCRDTAKCNKGKDQ